jgi:hypothetical protein
MYMANKSLDELYAENYLGMTSLGSGLIQEANNDVSDEEDSSEDTTPKFTKKKKGKFRADKHYAEKNTFDSLYNTFMEQFEDDEFGGFDEGGDDTFDGDTEFDDDMGDEQTFTLSELRAMSLGELSDLLSSGEDDDFDFDDSDDFGGDEDFDEEIPMESYGQTGGGAHHGANGNYSGKAGRQSPTTHVKGNGDADFSKQDTGYDPEDTEGSEGSSEGDGDYSGKAHRQPATSHVKGNGDANFGKQNTGYRTRSGKKDKNYF